jgi:hypothetical protein
MISQDKQLRDLYRKYFVIQDDQTVKHSRYVAFVKKSYTEIRKQKQGYINCCKCPPRLAMHAFTLFLMFDAT